MVQEQCIPPARGKGVPTSPAGHGGVRAGRRASPSRSPASLPSSRSPAAASSCGRVPCAGAVPGCAAGSAVSMPREQKHPTTTTQALVRGTKATAPAPRMRLGHHTPHMWGLCGQSCGLRWPNRPWPQQGCALRSPELAIPAPSRQHASHGTSTGKADGQVGSAGSFPDQQHLHPTPATPPADFPGDGGEDDPSTVPRRSWGAGTPLRRGFPTS